MSVKRRRVVVTGLGAICPIGSTPKEIWDAVATSQSGVSRPSGLPEKVLPIRAVGEARQFTGHIKDFGELDKEVQKNLRKALKVMCRECQMGVAAAQLALNDASYASGKFDPARVGTSFGSDYMVSDPQEFTEGIRICLNGEGQFELHRWPSDGMPQLFPLWLLKYLPNMPASHVTIYNDLRGPSNSITMREASPAICIRDAMHSICIDRIDAAVVGVTGTRLSLMKAMHTVQQEEVGLFDGDPQQASRPFDLHRQGMVPGEGAAAIFLEELNNAVQRGAHIYAEVLGAASAAVIDRNRVARRREAMRLAMIGALRDANLTPADIGFVMAHGLGTHSCDIEEAGALADVFGSHAVPVIAAKSYFGNLGAGSGLVEIILGILAIRNKCLFGTLNYVTPDPACPVDVVTEPRTPRTQRFLNVNVTPQGQASAAIIGAVSDL
ncbi:MAG: beta-ketoacyl-[acyl-carrier-protein] synthase family protein [Thermogutta sp.]